MNTWWRAVIEVSNEEGNVLGWLVGSDFETEMVPGVGDHLILGVDHLGHRIEDLGEADALPVLRRHMCVGDVSRRGPSCHVVIGACRHINIERMRRRDEWIEYSPDAVVCANGGCTRDYKRDADSAQWTCTQSGHDLCLDCDRPVRGSCRFCRYHHPSEFGFDDEDDDQHSDRP